MTSEGLARLFVGIGFFWTVLLLLIGVTAGFDKPTLWLGLLVRAMESETVRYVYLGLALFVVPVGMLTILRDILGDPADLWVKFAAPGAFLSLYFLFLLAALPDIAQPFFLAFDAVAPFEGLTNELAAVKSWLLRFLTAFVILGGVPGVIGAILSLTSGSGKRGGRR